MSGAKKKHEHTNLYVILIFKSTASVQWNMYQAHTALLYKAPISGQKLRP